MKWVWRPHASFVVVVWLEWPLKGHRHCLLFKDDIFESWVGGTVLASWSPASWWAARCGETSAHSRSPALCGELVAGEPELVFPSGAHTTLRALQQGFAWGHVEPRLTHNYAMSRLSNGSYVLVGGTYTRRFSPKRSSDQPVAQVTVRDSCQDPCPILKRSM